MTGPHGPGFQPLLTSIYLWPEEAVASGKARGMLVTAGSGPVRCYVSRELLDTGSEHSRSVFLRETGPQVTGASCLLFLRAGFGWTLKDLYFSHLHSGAVLLVHVRCLGEQDLD